MATIPVKVKRQSPSFSSVQSSNTLITQINTATSSFVSVGNIATTGKMGRSFPTVTSVVRMSTIVLTSADRLTPNSTQYWYMS